MERKLDDELTQLKQKLFGMASIVSQMLANSVKSLVERNAELARRVVDQDEEVNRYEVEIENLCIQLIARYQPTASDLRTLMMIVKINKDLERIGDHCQNIAQRAVYLADKPLVKPYVDIPRMCEMAYGMLKDSLDAFVQRNSALALDVCRRDDEVDHLRDQVIRELITYMMQDPSTIDRALQSILNSRDLERVADLATNIAEDVFYMIEGKSIAHTLGKKINP
ncbi:MAG: phosphate signaling complex protein PhoU [bacterium JZ-2024 1]